MESEEFFEEVRRRFSYLVRDHRFSEPVLEINPQIHFSTVTFMGKNLAVELILDPRDEWVDCKIARVLGGKKTKFYAVDEKGNRVRSELVETLERKGIQDIKFTKSKKKESFEDLVRSLLADYATILKEHGQEILHDSPNVFP